MLSFSSLKLSNELKEVISELGYTHLTPIQEQSLPLLLEGKDMIGQSKTGSGKTAAFAIPILEKLSKNLSTLQRQPILQTLILCPTRELSVQVTREIRKLAKKHIGLQVLPLTGGTPPGPQYAALEKGVHIVVGTPGRVLDHLLKRTLDLRQITTLVLDEADRMLEMGFAEEMEQILDAIPDERQTLFFSATFPSTIAEMSERYQKDAIRITIDENDANAPLIEQIAYLIDSNMDGDSFNDSLKQLLRILKQYNPSSALVFTNFKNTAALLATELKRLQISAGALHGDLEQAERDSVMAKFRNESMRVLVATDVAARGIDIHDLELVVNFELPQKADIYTHRIGRTGRAGKVGRAVSLISENQKSKLTEIAQPNTVEIISDPKIHEATPQTLAKEIDFKSKMTTLYISAGRKNKMRPGDILGALTGDAGGLEASDIGKIEIQDFFSFVAVKTSVSKKALLSLQNGRIKGRRVRAELAR